MGSTSFLGFSCPKLLLVFLNLLFLAGLRAVKVGTGKVVGNGTGTVRERERE